MAAQYYARLLRGDQVFLPARCSAGLAFAENQQGANRETTALIAEENLNTGTVSVPMNSGDQDNG